MTKFKIKYEATIPTFTQYENFKPTIEFDVNSLEELDDIRDKVLLEFEKSAKAIGNTKSSYIKK